MDKTILVRYGEIGLKGKNRGFFERALVGNISDTLRGLSVTKIAREHGRIFIKHRDETMEVVERLQRVFGIVSVSPTQLASLDMADIENKALEIMEDISPPENATFKVIARRSNKNFPLTSPEINREVGAHIFRNIEGLSVDVHNPDISLYIEIRKEQAYLYSDHHDAPGGLPVGVTGRGGLMISGGIDSPVAGWLAMKRGIEIVGIHFHSFPFTSERAKDKVVDLCGILAQYGGGFKLYIVHFTEIQREIKKNCPEELYITIMRRMMFRIAERISTKEKCSALFTGENLAQVASQTLESMDVIEKVVELPVLRPLITMDKKEIIEKAQEIGTYETSILPYEDCCTLFVPKHPAIKPNLRRVLAAEEKLPQGLLEDALDKTEVLQIT
ncbi:MAG: tRNA 4-thiouridine(8) synthase ThiI [Clostridia bacterium]|nr:tRNA 4-thiouridine(8) synthase ThiI [Clostridia bacterium]